MSNEADGYEVGYGRPPKRNQFKPGQSGNPRGRPKGTKNLKTDLVEELAETVVVREGGEPKKITKQRAFVKSTIANAIKGDGKAASIFLRLAEQLLEIDSGTSADAQLRPEERDVLLAAVLRTSGENADEVGSDPTSASAEDDAS